jgi:predicted PurR-regulated permease PerM
MIPDAKVAQPATLITKPAPAAATENGEAKGPDAPASLMPIGVRSMALSILAVLGLVFLMRYAQDVFIPASLAILIAYALDPIVSRVTRFGVPRVLAATMVFLGLLAGTGFGCYALRHQAIATIESLPEAAQKLRERLRELRDAPRGSSTALGKIQEAAKEIEKTASEAAADSGATPRGVTRVRIDEPAFRANDYLWSGSLGLLGLLSQAVMVMFLVFFILVSGDFFKRKLVRIVGTKLSEKRMTLEVINEINMQIERFLLIQILTSALVAVCTAAALWAFGVHQPAVWGLAAGIFNSIPYFGAIFVTAGLALVAFLQFGSVVMTLEVAGVSLAITSLEGFLLTPALMGRAARINGVAMFVGLLFWSWVWGVIGMIVAVPLMMVIKSICDRIENLQPIGELLGDR